ncbi:MAG: hypothetical protein HFG28_15375 [Eubacterium sp.]|nr:hypothetical protein [Eubacterium sp.]
MKLVISGRYSAIDNLIKEAEFVNTGVTMAVEYPEAYYYSGKCGKGTVVIHTDSGYINFKPALKKRFRNLDICIVGSKCEWIKHSGESCFVCKYNYSENVVTCCGGSTQPGSYSRDFDNTDSLDSYETLDLWEQRVCGTETSPF